MKKYIRSDRVEYNFGKGGPKYAIYVFDGDDNKWKPWGGWYRSLDEFDSDAFLDKINHPNFPNPEYNYDRNYLDVKVIPNGDDISEYVESSTSTNCSKRNRYVRSNYISCAERFDPVNSSPEELTEYIYDALDEAFDETNFVEEDLEQYKDTFTNELIKALNRLNLGDMQVETDFGTLTGDTKKIANTVVKAYIQAYKDGRLE